MFRMLEPREIAAGMAFTSGYVVLGNKREKVRQLGNAVTRPLPAIAAWEPVRHGLSSSAAVRRGSGRGNAGGFETGISKVGA
jgi:hypothetical protein